MATDDGVEVPGDLIDPLGFSVLFLVEGDGGSHHGVRLGR